MGIFFFSTFKKEGILFKLFSTDRRFALAPFLLSRTLFLSLLHKMSHYFLFLAPRRLLVLHMYLQIKLFSGTLHNLRLYPSSKESEGCPFYSYYFKRRRKKDLNLQQKHTFSHKNLTEILSTKTFHLMYENIKPLILFLVYFIYPPKLIFSESQTVDYSINDGHISKLLLDTSISY